MKCKGRALFCILLFVLGGVILAIALNQDPQHRGLDSFLEKDAACYDRNSEPYTAVVDSHIHFRGFGGESLPFKEVIEYFDKTGVRFSNVNGIGQVLPNVSTCTYYRDCPDTPVTPSIKNDFINAANYLKHKPENVHLTLSMTFPDLSKPQEISEIMELYDKEHPNLFKWMGEVNLMKQALLENHHVPATIEDITQWQEFMAILEERNIPINIHSDLGSNDENEKYLYLMEYVLESYPNNKIVWAHMGLSLELTNMPAVRHIEIMRRLLDRHENLFLDTSFRALYDYYFSQPEAESLYIDFFNDYSTRILPGTDFVASSNKDFADYQEELEVTSRIFQYLNDEAFRNIVLGENYFQLLDLDYHAPAICNAPLKSTLANDR